MKCKQCSLFRLSRQLARSSQANAVCTQTDARNQILYSVSGQHEANRTRPINQEQASILVLFPSKVKNQTPNYSKAMQ